MKLFGKSRDAAAEQEPVSEASPERQPGERKGRPTPTRKQAEAERRRRLQLSPKERKKMAREAERRRRMEAYEARDRTPEKELARNVVDSRFNIAEFVLPVMLLSLAATIVLQQYTQPFAYAMYGFLLLAILDGVLCWRRYKRLLLERHPRTDLTGKGLRFYVAGRVMTLRMMRTPKPTVKRGEKI